MHQLWVQLISLLCCSERVSEHVCMREREREEGGTEAACASTRDLLLSRLPPLSALYSSSLPFSPLPPCVFLFYFLILIFYFFLHFLFLSTLFIAASFFPCPFSYSHLSCSSPAVLPPFVPALHAEDDTSNFEEPEQAAPWPASAAQQGALPAGFQGQDLPFLGWFFSRALILLAKTE